MKTVTYPLRLDPGVYKRVAAVAKRRHKKLSEQFRELIDYGFLALPDLDTAEAVADTWEKLGPAPDIDYAKLDNA